MSLVQVQGRETRPEQQFLGRVGGDKVIGKAELIRSST